MNSKLKKIKHSGSNLKFFCALFAVAFLIIIMFSIFSKANVTTFSYGAVVLDAGHGGIDNGVSGKVTGVNESDINLEICKKLKTRFQDAGFNVVMTRENAGGLYGTTAPGFKRRDLFARKEIIEKTQPLLVISIHLNSFSDSSVRGTQVYYKEGSEQSERLAFFILNALNDLEDNARKTKTLVGDYYILNESDCLAVIVECGFLSNQQDEKLLLSSEYQTKLASAVFYGALCYLSDNDNKKVGL